MNYIFLKKKGRPRCCIKSPTVHALDDISINKRKKIEIFSTTFGATSNAATPQSHGAVDWFYGYHSTALDGGSCGVLEFNYHK